MYSARTCRAASPPRLLAAGLGVLLAVSGLLLPSALARLDRPDTAAAAAPDPAAAPRIRALFGQLPLSFEPNAGQFAPEVAFRARGADYALYLTATEAVLTLHAPAAGVEEPGVGTHPGPGHPGSQRRADSGATIPGMPDTAGRSAAVLRLALAGGAAVTPVGEQALPGRANYFLGDDPAAWRTDVPTYRQVRYAGVYPGIDLVYYGRPGALEYDFEVAPGAAPEQLALAIAGADAVEVDAVGDLVLRVGGAELRQHAPVLYQEQAGRRVPVAGGYVLRDDGTIGFAVGAYDASQPLTIDPVLVYSTRVGGTILPFGIAVDPAGNAYVTGLGLDDYPTTPGAFQTVYGGNDDVVVTKLNASGSAVVYSTYLGGSLQDRGFAIAVDSSGNAYVTGDTRSGNFPTTAGAFKPTCPTCQGFFASFDAFVTKLNPAGSALVYSTYLGGSFQDSAFGIAVDGAGNAFVTGITAATDFPTTAGAYQTVYAGDGTVFVTKLNAAGSALVYSTYVGSGIARAQGIAIDGVGNAYITGGCGHGYPATAGAFQAPSGACGAFVTKLNAAGSALLYSSILGRSQGFGIAVDSAGNAYVTGNAPANFPTTQGAVQQTFGGGADDAFVSKLNPVGSALVYSTYLGGSGADEGFGIGVDGGGNAYITGLTDSSNFPVTPDAVQLAFGGGTSDAFVTKLNAAGTAIVFSTYLGGSALDDGRAIAVDAVGNAYVTGNTGSANFPTTAGAAQPTEGRGFVAKLNPPTPLSTATATATPTPTSTATRTLTPTGTPLPAASPSPTGAPTGTPTATATPFLGLTFHQLFGPGGVPAGSIVAGPCPRPLVNCVELTLTGGFTVNGQLSGVAPGATITLQIPVVTASGASASVRTIVCAPAGAGGVATCIGTVSEPGIFPRVGGLVTTTVSAPPVPPAPTASTTGAAARAPVVPPLLPPLLLPLPALPPPAPALPPPLAPGPMLAVVGPSAAHPAPEVPVIPEADPLLLLAVGLGIWGARRRCRRG